MHNRASLALAAAIMACSGWAVYLAAGWPWKAALFPMAIGVPVFLLAAAEAAWALFGSADGARAMDFELSQDVPEPIARRRTWEILVWISGFFAAIVLLGFPVAVALFILLYLRIQGGESWLFSLVFSAAVWGFFYAVFARLLNLPFPAGWIQGWFGL
jgi:hypothetical protein